MIVFQKNVAYLFDYQLSAKWVNIIMKNTLIFSILSAFLLNSCLWSFDNSGIKGSGTVTKEQHVVSPFDKIDVSGSFTVYLSQGDVESVEVELDDNLQQYVEVRNEGSKLILGIKDKINFGGVANVELRGNATELNINQSGVGNFNAKKLEAAKVTVVNSGVGSVSVYATQELSMTNSGVGSITYSGDAKILKLDSSGVGKIKKEK